MVAENSKTEAKPKGRREVKAASLFQRFLPVMGGDQHTLALQEEAWDVYEWSQMVFPTTGFTTGAHPV